MKFAFIAKHRSIWPVAWLCEALGVSRSGFHAWLNRSPSQHARYDEALLDKIKDSFKDSDRTYGARRVWHDLLAEGLSCGLHRVERLMRDNALRARPRRRGLPKDDGERPVIMPNVLDRQFAAARPNHKWVADFTYVATWSGFVYVAFVIDVYARCIVGWRVATSMKTGLVLDALEQALWARKHRQGLIHHSDRGSQYLSIRYTERMADEGIDASVGTTGDSYDNALAETIIGLFKTEVIHHRGPWKGRDAVEYATLGWVDWFNNRRLLEPIGNVPPAERERTYYRQLEESGEAA